MNLFDEWPSNRGLCDLAQFDESAGNFFSFRFFCTEHWHETKVFAPFGAVK